MGAGLWGAFNPAGLPRLCFLSALWAPAKRAGAGCGICLPVCAHVLPAQLPVCADVGTLAPWQHLPGPLKGAKVAEARARQEGSGRHS